MVAGVKMDRLEWGKARADKVEVGIGQEPSKKSSIRRGYRQQARGNHCLRVDWNCQEINRAVRSMRATGGKPACRPHVQPLTG
jgi:hypothetical protein